MLRKIVLAVLLFASSLQLSGCFALFVGAAAGAGGMIWAKGKLVQDLNAPLDRAHRAAVAAFKRLELPANVDRKDKLSAKLESLYADGKHVWVDLDYVTKSTTRIEIRVGTLGDENRSREILNEIVRGL